MPKPKIDLNLLKEQDYYLFYEMVAQALKTDDVKEGMQSSLDILKTFLNCNDIILYKKNENGKYKFASCHSDFSHLINPITHIVNKTASITEKKGLFDLDLELKVYFGELKLLYLKTDEQEYILSLSDAKPIKEIDSTFFTRLQETMGIILKGVEKYEENLMAISNDLLTGLDNRNSYEIEVRELSDDDETIVYGVFDLFRLKYINDNFSHASGDRYIVEAANILKKYWPKYMIQYEHGAEKVVETGNCIYRYGGDEFILITRSEDIKLTKIKAELAAEEVKNLVLGYENGQPVKVGLNYGIAKHEIGLTIKETINVADRLMYENKNQMYADYRLDKRAI